GPSGATPIQFALLVDVDTKESVVELQALASSVVKLAIYRNIARRTPLRAHLVRLIGSQFDDKIRAINAFPLDMCVFDIILGMDWLTEHHATIDCHSYRVIFGDIHAPEYTYHGSLSGKSMQIISALQARTLLYHGCEGFLAMIHDTTSEIPSIHDQPIVSEFPDVFPDELPGIPPVHEVEFNI
nr:putative reverse transcriptase domain, aspartic peptidase domain protein [Tanacetum cinerariifolium]